VTIARPCKVARAVAGAATPSPRPVRVNPS
jgi:hypothetical protein